MKKLWLVGAASLLLIALLLDTASAQRSGVRSGVIGEAPSGDVRSGVIGGGYRGAPSTGAIAGVGPTPTLTRASPGPVVSGSESAERSAAR